MRYVVRQLMRQQYLWTVRFVGETEEIIKEEFVYDNQ